VFCKENVTPKSKYLKFHGKNEKSKMKANENWNLGLNWSESECLKVKLGEALNIATKSIIN